MPSAPNPAMIAREWVHSHEEDPSYPGGALVFRPASYSFPPSRGRWRLTLHSDHSMTESQPGPVDRPVASSGSWSLNQHGQLVFESPGKPDAVANILEASPDKLVITPPTTGST